MRGGPYRSDYVIAGAWHAVSRGGDGSADVASRPALRETPIGSTGYTLSARRVGRLTGAVRNGPTLAANDVASSSHSVRSSLHCPNRSTSRAFDPSRRPSHSQQSSLAPLRLRHAAVISIAGLLFVTSYFAPLPGFLWAGGPAARGRSKIAI